MTPIQEEYLISLREDFHALGSYLQEISSAVIKEQISAYPIYLVHNEPAISLGRLIIDSGKSRTNWSFSASIIEELLRREIIDFDRLDEFKSIYKDPHHYACVLMLTKEMTDFVFIPYEGQIEDESSEDSEESPIHRGDGGIHFENF